MGKMTKETVGHVISILVILSPNQTPNKREIGPRTTFRHLNISSDLSERIAVEMSKLLGVNVSVKNLPSGRYWDQTSVEQLILILNGLLLADEKSRREQKGNS